jgi:hypothetical protein
MESTEGWFFRRPSGGFGGSDGSVTCRLVI